MQPNGLLSDPLTGVYSRAYLNTRLQEELQRALRYNQTFSLLLVDLDYFKSINDAFGHLYGDQVMAEFAARIHAAVRSSDLVFRYGGDEFVILMPNTVIPRAVILADRLLEQTRAKPFGDKPPVLLTMSCGLASFPDDGQTAETLFEVADQRHFLAKRLGRNCLVKETPQPLRPTSEDFSRLIERDEELATVQSFLVDLPLAGRGAIRVSGAPGSGITRFLQETSKSARLRGFGVLTLRSMPAQKNRLFSALFDTLADHNLVAMDQFESLFYALDLQARLTQILESWIIEKGYAGILVTLDDLQYLDRASLDTLRALYFTPQKFPLGLAFADNGVNAQQSFPLGVPVREIVQLSSISPSGVQIWLRNRLRWEAPFEFAEWLSAKTYGRPRLIQSALENLIQSGMLVQGANKWSLALTYKDQALGLPEFSGSAQIGFAHFAIPATDFIGRQSEIYKLRELILEERLVTILGMGGMGKTRLALQVASENQDRFQHGVLLAPLGAIFSADSLVYVLADALNFRLAGTRPPLDQLIDYLKDKEILFVLDRFEHIRSANGLLAYILQNTLAVHFLVTSRERLGLRQEVVFELEGLNFPLSPDKSSLESYSAVQLFLQIARRVRPGFVISQDDWPYVVRICQYFSGMPLGIELAAAWVETLSCAEISAQFDKSLELATTKPSAQQTPSYTLKSMIDSMWGMFSQQEQDALCGLALFHGSFSREAARQVVGASLFFLDALINKSILRHAGQDRYVMHELLNQQLLGLQVGLPDRLQEIRERYAGYYLGLLATVEGMVNQSRQKEALAIINADIDDVRVAWEWAVENRRYETLSTSANSLFIFLEQRGRFREGRELFFVLLQALQNLPAQEETPETHWLRTKALAVLGEFEYNLGDYPISLERLKTALVDFHNLADLEEVAHTHYVLANLFRATGEYEQARALLNQSLDYYRQSGNRRAEGDILNSLGVIASGLGDAELAESYYAFSLANFQSLNDRAKVARALNNMGYSAMERGDYDNGIRLLVESLELSKDVGVDPLTGSILDSLGAIHCAAGNYATSLQYYREGLRLSLRLNTLPLTLEILLGLANISLGQNDLEKAAELMWMVYAHPSAVHEIRQRAGDMLAQVKEQLPSETYEQLRSNKSKKSIDQILTELVFERDSLSV